MGLEVTREIVAVSIWCDAPGCENSPVMMLGAYGMSKPVFACMDAALESGWAEVAQYEGKPKWFCRLHKWHS